MGNVGGGAAHIEADDLVESRGERRPDRPDHTARRAGDRMLSLPRNRWDSASPPLDCMNSKREP